MPPNQMSRQQNKRRPDEMQQPNTKQKKNGVSIVPVIFAVLGGFFGGYFINLGLIGDLIGIAIGAGIGMLLVYAWRKLPE